MSCDHLACRIPAILRPADVDAVVIATRPGGAVLHARVYHAGRFIGSVMDRGFTPFTAHRDDWVPAWDVFAGGNHVAARLPDMAAAVAKLCDHVAWASFHARMALH
jgi:hypothetical protein